ncbi:MAG TPA: hypothetical protein VNH64_02355 [Parvularculaceae bacterium]|nr:hypothetical protein [Parvularculaceae bacterium]
MKLPVIKGFAAGFAYLFTHFIDIIKGLWLPVLLLQAALIYVMPHYLGPVMQMHSVSDHPDPQAALAALRPVLGWGFLLFLSTIIFYPMMQASVLKPLVRGEKPSLPFYLQYGGDEFRLLFTLVLFVIMMIVVGLVSWLGALVSAVALGALLHKAGAIFSLFICLAIIIAVIWFMLRLSLMFAATVGARRIGLAESWRVTKRNAGLLFFYWFLWGIVLMIVGAIYAAIAMSGMSALWAQFFHDLSANMHDHAAMKSAMEDWRQSMMQYQASLWDSSKPSFWVFQTATYFYQIVKVAIGSVAAGVAYRFLTDGE